VPLADCDRRFASGVNFEPTLSAVSTGKENGDRRFERGKFAETSPNQRPCVPLVKFKMCELLTKELFCWERCPFDCAVAAGYEEVPSPRDRECMTGAALRLLKVRLNDSATSLVALSILTNRSATAYGN
jgi:hypothetical protein